MLSRNRIEGNLELGDHISINFALTQVGILHRGVVFTTERRRLNTEKNSTIVTILCVSIPMSELQKGTYAGSNTDVTHRFPQTKNIIDAGPKDFLWFNHWTTLGKNIQLYFVYDVHRAGCWQNLLNILQRF